MNKNLFIFIIVSVFFILAASPVTAEILGPEIKIQDNDIFVNTGLTNTAEIEAMINSGVEKEILFTIELFRSWNFWPDEFIASQKIQRIIKYDNLRGQYLISSYNGKLQIEKKFKNFDASMKNWVFALNKINLANTKELEPGKYYIRIVVESKSRELPHVIGLLMLFIPEVEMSLAKESEVFIVEDIKHEKS